MEFNREIELNLESILIIEAFIEWFKHRDSKVKEVVEERKNGLMNEDRTSLENLLKHHPAELSDSELKSKVINLLGLFGDHLVEIRRDIEEKNQNGGDR